MLISRFQDEFMSVLHQCTTIHGIAGKTFTAHANQTHSEPAYYWVYKVAAHTEMRVHMLWISACCRLRSKHRAEMKEREGSDSSRWLTGLISITNEALPTSPPIHLSRSPIFLLLSNFLKCQVRFLCYFASIPCWKDLHMSCLDAWGMLMLPAGYLKFQMKTLSLWVQRCTHPCVVQNLYDSPGTQKWEIAKNILVCAFAINGDWGFLVSKPCKKSGP